MDIASYRVGPYPRWLYHTVEPPLMVYTLAEEISFDTTWKREYQHQDYPKMMFSPDGKESKAAADAEEEALLANEGWTDTPPVLPDVAPVTLDPTSASVPAAGGSGSFTVTMNGPAVSNTWTVDQQSEAAAWLHLVSPPEDTPQPADGTVNYTVDENTDVARSGAFYCNGKTHTVSQDGVAAGATKTKNR